MNFNKIPFFTSKLNLGFIVLVSLIILVQFFIIYIKDIEVLKDDKNVKQQWLVYEDSLIRMNQEEIQKQKIYPFNPNFIDDFKGYKLEMSTKEIDRLLKFRANNKFVNSAEEFQKVTGVSNSWMKKYTPFFKFPDWVKNNKNNNFIKAKIEKTIDKIDLNQANQIDLEKVYMIGEKLANRIIDQREKLGGYVSMEQLNYIWGISPEAIADLNKKYYINPSDRIKKININNSTLKEISQFPYFNFNVAKEIVTFRSMNGDINSNDLIKIKHFPVDKLKIIVLYLDF